jgi:hypothetical protein
MSGEHRKSRKAQLARALAQGISATQWARDHGVPKTTVYRWSKDPAVRVQIESIRQQRD